MKQLRVNIITQWFSQDFITWGRKFGLFLITYTLVALLVDYTFNFIFPFLIGFALALCAQPLIRLFQKKLRLTHGLASVLVTVFILIGVFSLVGWIAFLSGRELIILVKPVIGR